METKFKFLIVVFIIHLGFTVQAQVMNTQLARAYRVFEQDGYDLTHEILESSLDDGESENKYFTLKEGWSYKIVVVCDNDCSDIDFCIHDENENDIDCDEDSSDLAINEVSPKWTGRFHAYVKMYDCSIEPCTYKVAIFGRRNF